MAKETKGKAPLIGEFKGPRNNAPRTSKSDEEEQESNESKTSAPAEAKAEAYRKGLEEVGISIEEAREILDRVLFEHGYSETVKLGGKMPVTLRTRVYKDSVRVMRLIEAEAPTMPMHVSDLVARYNVAASLGAYGDTTFEFPAGDDVTEDAVENAFDIRLQFVLELPTPVIDRLITMTGDFDRKVAAVFADGAPEDF